MVTDVDFHQSGYAAFFDVFVVAPKLVGHDKLAELRAPVAEVIDADGVVAQFFVYAVKRRADCG